MQGSQEQHLPPTSGSLGGVMEIHKGPSSWPVSWSAWLESSRLIPTVLRHSCVLTADSAQGGPTVCELTVFRDYLCLWGDCAQKQLFQETLWERAMLGAI